MYLLIGAAFIWLWYYRPLWAALRRPAHIRFQRLTCTMDVHPPTQLQLYTLDDAPVDAKAYATEYRVGDRMHVVHSSRLHWPIQREGRRVYVQRATLHTNDCESGGEARDVTRHVRMCAGHYGDFHLHDQNRVQVWSLFPHMHDTDAVLQLRLVSLSMRAPYRCGVADATLRMNDELRLLRPYVA